ncbi:MAG: hypothetical protein ACREQV_03155 [Candidatus Binatia bacterium]
MRRKIMLRFLTGFLFAFAALAAVQPNGLPAATEQLDGTFRLTSRLASSGIGLSWGDGVLTYKGQDYPFTFQAKGLFRDVDPAITAAELSGEVFNLKRVAIFNGTYHAVEAGSSGSGGGTRATMKNSNGVIVKIASKLEGHKFVLGRDGMSITLKQQKP